MDDAGELRTAEDFTIVSVNRTYNFEFFEADGILGLSKVNPGQLKNSLFVEQLYEQGLINKKLFSVELGHENEDSWIHFGSSDNSGQFKTLKTIDGDFHWTLPLKDF